LLGIGIKDDNPFPARKPGGLHQNTNAASENCLIRGYFRPLAFWDGNGRIARLLANIPLLRAGLPPLTIPQDKRRTYIQILANYQIAIGQLNEGTGVWPDISRLMEFNQFCASCYAPTEKLVTAAYETQGRRD